MVLLIGHPEGHHAERSYILDVLFHDFLGLDYVAAPHQDPFVTIRLSDDDVGKRLDIAEVFFSKPQSEWLTEDSLPRRPLERWTAPAKSVLSVSLEGAQVPVIYGAAKEGELFTCSEGTSYLGIDVLGSAFFMLTQYQEAVSRERDDFDRFPASASLAFQEGFLQRPIVNEYLEILWAVMRRMWPGLKRKARTYRVFLSHDMDEVSLLGRSWPSVIRSLAADLLLRREGRLALQRLRAFAKTRATRKPVAGDPYNTFDFIMATSERFELRDTFNFVAAESKHRLDPRYDLRQPWIRGLIKRIYNRGHGIGLHPSINTYKDAALIMREYQRLRRVCAEENVTQETWGGRQHYLRWANPTTWQSWEAAGLDYDSSLGYAQHVGFRCGCCYEYPVMNLQTGQRLRLRERPLVAMESSLLSYMGCSLRAAERWLRDLIATCRRYDGDFSLLWHNHMLVADAAKKTYSQVVAAAAP